MGLNDFELRNKLREIDWNFPESNNKDGIHNIHPYPAKFIPEIPRYLMDIIEIPENTAILDIFCGSGTTLVEAQRKGIESIGIDLNPIACLISKVKTQCLPTEFEKIAIECTEKSKCMLTGKDINIPNVDHWFKKNIQYALESITTNINLVNNVKVKDALNLVLSSIIVRVSNQESDTRYAAIEKNINADDVFNLFLRGCYRLMAVKNETKISYSDVKIINKDILTVKPTDIETKIGLVITSPPYPNAYEYWLYHKYRMWWLGYNPNGVKEKEIGARAHYFKKNAQTIDDFIYQMDTVFKLLDKVVVENGYVCFVVGRSIIKGEYINNANIIETSANKYNFTTVDDIERNILKTRKSFNLSHANIKKENVLVFRKEKVGVNYKSKIVLE